MADCRTEHTDSQRSVLCGTVLRPWQQAPAPPSHSADSPLAPVAAFWRGQEHTRGLLLHDQALDEAEAWAARHADELSEDEQDFLQACRENREHERRQSGLAATARCLISVAAILGFLALGGWAESHRRMSHLQAALRAAEGSLAKEQQARGSAELVASSMRALRDEAAEARRLAEEDSDQANIRAGVAESRALAARAHAMADREGELAILLALEAMHRAESVPDLSEASFLARSELYRALGHPGWVRTVLLEGSGGMRTTAWLSPSGKAVSSGPGGKALIWDAATGGALVELEGQRERIVRAAWSPNEDLVATADPGGRVTIWDSASGQSGSTLDDSAGLVSMVWCPDNKRLAMTDTLGRVSVWETATGSRLWRSKAGENAPTDLAWSGDGTRLFLTTEQGETATLDAESGQVDVARGRVLTGPSLHRIGGSGAYIADQEGGHQRLYLLSSAALTKVACTRASRNLTAAEWRRYLGSDVPLRTTCPGLSH